MNAGSFATFVSNGWYPGPWIAMAACWLLLGCGSPGKPSGTTATGWSGSPNGGNLVNKTSCRAQAAAAFPAREQENPTHPCQARQALLLLCYVQHFRSLGCGLVVAGALGPRR